MIKTWVMQPVLAAFTLIELGLVLLIVGVLMGAVFKGQDLLQSAKIGSVLDDLKRYQHLIMQYQHTYHAWPGDDSHASSHFEGGEDGDGDDVITGHDEPRVWQHLALAKMLSHGRTPTSKLGGTYRVTTHPTPALSGLYLVLGQGDDSLNGLLTPKQAQLLMKKADDGGPKEGFMRVIDGKNAVGECVEDNHFRVQHDKPVCVVAVPLQ